jgi:glycosyltransferase involved in cell wall biosynthesis
MKVLIPIYEIQDYGGITAHTEFLMRGLKEHGHEVGLVILRNNDQPPYAKKATGPKGSYKSYSGGEVHLLAGWYGVPIMSYGTPARAEVFVQQAKNYDLIIWDLPCPYKDEGAWRELYEIDVPQVAVIHDAHYERAYKHLDDVAHRLSFVAPVNESAFGALAKFPGKRKLINNGHEMLDWKSFTPWDKRARTAVCAHVWKAWKQMHRVVEAAPYCSSTIIMGGDGIEGRYMRSKDKCKPKYVGMWEMFTQSRNHYVGVVTPDELYALYQSSRVMIDLSWNERFAKYGCHYNRSIVEGANNGCVPLVTTEFFAGSRVFPEGTYFSIEKDAPMQALADCIDTIMDSDVKSMLFDLRCIISDHFDYRKTSLQYLGGL